MDQLIRNENHGISLSQLHRTSFQQIRDAIGESCQVVLIGEATHGTEEFYRIRIELTKALLEDGFDAVLCEGDFPPFSEVNRFVGGAQGGRETVSAQSPREPDNDEESFSNTGSSAAITKVSQAMAGLRDRFPEWMWSNNAMREFVIWLRHFNSRRAQSSSGQEKNETITGDRRLFPIQLFGLDIYTLFRSADEVIGYLYGAGEFDLARQAQDRYSTLNSFRPEPKEYGRAVHNDTITSQASNVAKMLTALYQHENRLYQNSGNGQELFNAIENARVVAAAESYFRQLFEEDDMTWNLRDSAFLNTVKEVITHVEQQKKALGRGSEKARVIVWAHNSHVGDARATENASKRKHSLGQLCREAFGKQNVYIIGFSSYDGKVRAASHWGGRDQVMELNPAFEGSHEYLLHMIAKKRTQNAFGYTLRSNSGSATVDEVARKLLKMDRVERFVGANYIPETELRSHYLICNMSEQFDFILHVDHSTALHVD